MDSLGKTFKCRDSLAPFFLDFHWSKRCNSARKMPPLPRRNPMRRRGWCYGVSRGALGSLPTEMSKLVHSGVWTRGVRLFEICCASLHFLYFHFFNFLLQTSVVSFCLVFISWYVQTCIFEYLFFWFIWLQLYYFLC